MISNRDTNNSMAKVIAKKKQAEQESSENKEKKKMMIAYVSIGAIAVLLVIIGIFNFSSSEETKPSDFGTPQTDSEKYNTKLDAIGAKEKNNSNPNLLDVFSQQEQIEEPEEDLEEQKLKENLRALKEGSSSNSTAPTSNKKGGVYGDYSMWEDGEEKTTPTRSTGRSSGSSTTNSRNTPLTYQEKIEKAKEARLGKSNTSVTSNQGNVETRVAIFRDQFLLPGELAELVLTKDFTFNGNLFKKGTPVYAYINISKTRVLFEVKNIAHIPINLEVRDIRDGMIGMYSSRAGELWKKYENDAVNKTTDEVAGEITDSKAISYSINALSKFFQSKRIKDSEKIMLLNDQELIVNILTEK